MAEHGVDITEKLDELEAVVRRVEKQDEETRAKVVELGKHLGALCSRASIYAQTGEFTIEERADDERIYGYLAAGAGGLYLCHRSTFEDITARDDEEQYFSIAYAPTWPAEWLRAAATKENLDALIGAVKTAAERVLTGQAVVVEHVKRVGDSRIADLEKGLIDAAGEFGFPRLVEEWGRAQREMHGNPAAAITAACCLLESTMKHALEELDLELPLKQTIQGLYKAVAPQLNLGMEGEGDAEVRSFVHGVSSIVQNIGSFRTKIGDAHGKADGQRSGAVDDARLAVNLAGSLSTYLLRQLASMKRGRTAPTSPSSPHQT